MSITSENFKSDLSKILSKDDLRPILTVVSFQNGFAYATNAHALIKQSLEWLRANYGATKPLEEAQIVNKCTAEDVVSKYN